MQSPKRICAQRVGDTQAAEGSGEQSPLLPPFLRGVNDSASSDDEDDESKKVVQDEDSETDLELSQTDEELHEGAVDHTAADAASAADAPAHDSTAAAADDDGDTSELEDQRQEEETPGGEGVKPRTAANTTPRGTPSRTPHPAHHFVRNHTPRGAAL
jgi:hypothetical protein